MPPTNPMSRATDSCALLSASMAALMYVIRFEQLSSEVHFAPGRQGRLQLLSKAGIVAMELAHDAEEMTPKFVVLRPVLGVSPGYGGYRKRTKP